MMRKVLIANRGEIACRIIRTCRAMGLATVAVYSEADSSALHVEMADEAVYLGPSAAAESYLNVEKILEAAARSGADTIHPGYGFLAENAGFAYRVKSTGLTFIGPPPEAIEAMGDKRIAKLLLRGVPYVPGYTGEEQSNDVLIAAAQEIGFPIMVKATAGGGGKGMRQVAAAAALPDALEAARREARQAFGNDTLMLERVVSSPRHIEVQIFGDQHGHVIALGERECTIQRRHQKIIEETPSTALTDDLRRQMCEVAVSIGRQLGYYSAGTVEFLLDENGHFYFMEMNTRLQVEHPVTEMVYGVDLVRWQFQVARGVSLEQLLPTGSDLSQPLPLPASGHAVEVRIYAEEPANHFLPATGTILHWQAPADIVRVDTGIRTGDEVTTFYDPMIAKIIAHDSTRLETLRKLDYALSQLQLLGLGHNVAFLRRVLMHTDHLGGVISTHFIEEHPKLLLEAPAPPHVLIAAALAAESGQRHWRNNPNRPIRHSFTHSDGTQQDVLLAPLRPAHYTVTIEQQEYAVQLSSTVPPLLQCTIDGHRRSAAVVQDRDDTWWVHSGQAYVLRRVDPLPPPGHRHSAAGSLRAPMPGQVTQVLVQQGQQVQQGQLLMILEAMKMEHRIEAPDDGHIATLYYQAGDTVQADAVLLELSNISGENTG